MICAETGNSGRNSCFPHLRTPCNFHACDGKRCIKSNGSASYIILFPAKAVHLVETGKRSDIDSWDLIRSVLVDLLQILALVESEPA
jgi:hypothetical protein